MIRTASAIAAGLLCMVAGFRHAQTLQTACQRLQRWIALLRHLSLLLAEGAGSLPEVMEQTAREQTLPDQILLAVAQGLRLQPMLPPHQLADLSQLPPEEQDAISRLLLRLGRGSRESRIQAVDGCVEELRLLLESARSKAEHDGKMWRQLSLLAGACLTLWLI